MNAMTGTMKTLAVYAKQKDTKNPKQWIAHYINALISPQAVPAYVYMNAMLQVFGQKPYKLNEQTTTLLNRVASECMHQSIDFGRYCVAQMLTMSNSPKFRHFYPSMLSGDRARIRYMANVKAARERYGADVPFFPKMYAFDRVSRIRAVEDDYIRFAIEECRAERGYTFDEVTQKYGIDTSMTERDRGSNDLYYRIARWEAIDSAVRQAVGEDGVSSFRVPADVPDSIVVRYVSFANR